MAVEALLTARRAFTGTKADDLTALVDQFARIADETAALGPVQSLLLAVHSGNPGNPSQTASHESTAIIDSLADAMRELHIQHPWPPAYFNERELLILAQTPVARALAGVDPDHRDHATDTAAPSASRSPCAATPWRTTAPARTGPSSSRPSASETVRRPRRGSMSSVPITPRRLPRCPSFFLPPLRG